MRWILLLAFLSVLGVAASDFKGLRLLSPKRSIPAYTYKKATYFIPESIVPADALSTAEHTINQLVFDGLFTVKNSGEIVPQLVETWSFKEDTFTYEFQLRPAQFHDHTAVTTSDVVVSLRYLVEKSKNKNHFENVAEIYERNGVVFIKVKNPKKNLLPPLASPVAKIWKTEPGKEPIGSGDFAIIRHERAKGASSLLLERRNWNHLEAENVFSLELREMAEDQAVSALLAGEVHDIVDLPLSKGHAIPRGFRTIRSGSVQTWLIAPNHQSHLLKEESVRQCLMSTINAEEVARLFPEHSVAKSYLPPQLRTKPVEFVVRKHGDCKRAKDHTWTLDLPKEISQSSEVCAVIQRQFASGGIRLNCKIMPFDELLGRIQSQKAELSFLGMSMDFPSTEYFVNTFHSKAGFRLVNLQSPEFDHLIDRIEMSGDAKERTEILSMIDDKIAAGAHLFPISHPQFITYASKCVKNLSVSMLGPSFTSYRSVEMDLDCLEKAHGS